MTNGNDPHDDEHHNDNKASPSGAGEDESSTEQEGKDGHLHDDQKSKPLET